ncbi:conserved unknown protein [Ectocarpus siliculosus]|uniref:FAD-binding oxidoreductase/transferase type 4 C-terminal domain-containing protein n=1 Tax=Ectocarpus siliculosus TaxID=2880 RepID=D8LHN1_ECTSI|nr:conserved unknown protein [Ectocarpus siliculosus]|eukprot:CBN79313.1 conserved unknown protein [Ectocarpus siliculosus]
MADCRARARQPGRADVLAALEPFVFEWVVSRRGSISAEHGVGQHKRGYLSLQRPEAVLGVMRGVKGMLDPRGIMNPFKHCYGTGKIKCAMVPVAVGVELPVLGCVPSVINRW